MQTHIDRARYSERAARPYSGSFLFTPPPPRPPDFPRQTPLKRKGTWKYSIISESGEGDFQGRKATMNCGPPGDALRRVRPHVRDVIGDATGARAAEDVGPYHTTHVLPAPGRARRPRRAAHMGRQRGCHGDATGTRAAEDVDPYHLRTHGRARRPRRAAPTKTPTETSTGARAAEDVGPYHILPLVRWPQ